MAFALFLVAFLIDAALAKMIDDLVDIVSADLAIVKNSDNLLFQKWVWTFKIPMLPNENMRNKFF